MLLVKILCALTMRESRVVKAVSVLPSTEPVSGYTGIRVTKVLETYIMSVYIYIKYIFIDIKYIFIYLYIHK